MTYSDVVGLTSGLLQLAVACYALRLSSRFGTARVGWLVFGAFSLLALVHSFLAVNPFRATLEPGIVPDLTYGVVSVLLLISIARLEGFLRKRWQADTVAHQNLTVWETQVEGQVAELSRANAELLRADARLQSELVEQKRITEEQETTFQTLLTAARQTENDLLQTVTSLQTKVSEHQQKLAAARQAGMAEVADRLLATIDALGLIAGDLAKSRTAHVVHTAQLLQKRPRHPDPLTPSPRRKRLPESLAQLARRLAAEQSALAQRIDSIRHGLERVREAAAAGAPTLSAEALELATAEAAANSSSLAANPAAMGETDFRDHLIHNVTETGTEVLSRETEAATEDEETDRVPGASEARA